MRVSFLTPWGALVGLAVVVPLVAFWLREHRAGRVRRLLRLEPPPARSHLPAVAALLCAFLLLGSAAAQPIVRATRSLPVRDDAEVFVVLDTTRSMLAASAPGARTRFERAVDFSLRLRSALPRVSVGVATITNRPLPHLFPSPDQAAFRATVIGAIGINRPPPGRDVFRRSTSFESLEAMATENYFAPDSVRRLVVLLSDNETQAFPPMTLVKELREGGVQLVSVRFWGPDERIWLSDGRFDPGYRTSAQAQTWMRDVAAATLGGRVFEEQEARQVVALVRAYLGEGPTRALVTAGRGRPLGIYLVLAAALPLAALLARGLTPAARDRSAGFLHTVCSARARDPRGRRRPAHEEREHRRGGADPRSDRRGAARAGPASQGGGART
jgi:hypothetical protein